MVAALPDSARNQAQGASSTADRSCVPAMTLLLLVVAVGSAVSAALLWSRRGTPGRRPLILLFAGVAIWTIGYAGEITAGELGSKARWVPVEYMGIVVLPVAVLLFTLEYTGRGEWLTWPRLATLATIPLATLVPAWIDGLDHLVWRTVGTEVRAGRPLALEHGPVFHVYVGFAYCALLVAMALLIRARLSLRPSFRRQSLALAFALATPSLCNVLYVVGLRPSGLDLTPFAFAVGAVAFMLARRRWGLLDIAPVARHALIEHLRDGMLVIDARGRIVDCNRAIAPLLTCPVEDAVGRHGATGLVVSLDDLCSGQTVEVGTDDGPRQYEIQTIDLPPTVAATARLLLFRDVTSRERLHELLRAEALTDDLTELPNRRSFLATLQRMLADPHRRVGVLFLDVDDFKRINDALGHHAGDQILVAIGRRLTRCVRAEDIVARLAGDEFAVCLPDVEGPEIPMAVAERIASAVRKPIDVDGHRIEVTASIGLHLATAADTTPDAVLQAADRRMYLAKQSRAS